VAGLHHHTVAIGHLVASLYDAGQPSLRHGLDDPGPGVPSITAVIGQLDTSDLNRVVTVTTDTQLPTVTVQGKCTWRHLAAVLGPKGWAVAADAACRPTQDQQTVGSAVKLGQVQPVWAEVLTADGRISRHDATQPGGWSLPPDALIVAVALPLARA
jgi:hypothetical protein